MAKSKKTVYFCQNCGYESAKWMGQCPGCKEWNTFVEETISPLSPAGKSTKRNTDIPKPMGLSEISLTQDSRKTSKMEELDRVLGGGIVQGSLVLVGGIRELENRPFSSRCAVIWRSRRLKCCIFPARSLCVRLKCGLCALGILMIT